MLLNLLAQPPNNQRQKKNNNLSRLRLPSKLLNSLKKLPKKLQNNLPKKLLRLKSPRKLPKAVLPPQHQASPQARGLKLVSQYQGCDREYRKD